MNTRNTSSAWTKTAWCTPRNLWSNLAPTLCGRSSVCGCIAPSVAGLTHGSSGRSQTCLSPITSPQACPLYFLLLLFPSRVSFTLFMLFLLLLVSRSSCSSQGTKTMWQLTLLPTLASINSRADTACTHWRLTGRCSFSAWNKFSLKSVYNS